MNGLYWAQKNNLDPKGSYRYWPVDVNQMLGYRRVALHGDMPSIDSVASPAIPPLKPICSILRRQAAYRVRTDENGDELREYDEYDVADLAALKVAFNLPMDEIAGDHVDHDLSRPCYLMLIGSPLRILADMLMDFTFMLVSNYGIDGKRPVYGLHEHNPIAVCRHCDGLFIRTRSDGEYCSVKCRSAAWSQNKGKEYFAQKQREFRAAKRKQREAQRRRKK